MMRANKNSAAYKSTHAYPYTHIYGTAQFQMVIHPERYSNKNTNDFLLLNLKHDANDLKRITRSRSFDAQNYINLNLKSLHILFIYLFTFMVARRDETIPLISRD